MSEVDLDIENYELEDILNLFKLQYNFVEADLKRAYRIALKLHPDKSGLDAEYFRFYLDNHKSEKLKLYTIRFSLKMRFE